MCASNSSICADPALGRGEVEGGGLPREAGGTTGEPVAEEGADCPPSAGAADRGNVAAPGAERSPPSTPPRPQLASTSNRPSASVRIARIVRVSPPVRARSFSGESAESGTSHPDAPAHATAAARALAARAAPAGRRRDRVQRRAFLRAGPRDLGGGGPLLHREPQAGGHVRRRAHPDARFPAGVRLPAREVLHRLRRAEGVRE